MAQQRLAEGSEEAASVGLINYKAEGTEDEEGKEKEEKRERKRDSERSALPCHCLWMPYTRTPFPENLTRTTVCASTATRAAVLIAVYMTHGVSTWVYVGGCGNPCAGKGERALAAQRECVHVCVCVCVYAGACLLLSLSPQTQKEKRN